MALARDPLLNLPSNPGESLTASTTVVAGSPS
jgi:hypothetical protein